MSDSHFPGNHQNSVPEPSTSSIISHAIEMYKGVLVYAVVGFLIYCALNLTADAILNFDLFFTLSNLEESNGNWAVNMINAPGFFGYALVSNLISVLISPIYIGLLFIISKHNSNQNAEVGDLFIGYKQNLVNILIYSLIAHILLSIASSFCVIPMFFVAPFLLLGFPILLFENATATDALRKSFDVAKENYGVFLGVSIVGFFLSILGVFVCFIGIIITAFFFVAIMYSTYVAYLGKPKPLLDKV